MKKTAVFIINITIIIFMASLCIADGCKTSTGALKNCGDSWEDVYNGVKTHCDCVCIDSSCTGAGCYNSPPVCYDEPASGSTGSVSRAGSTGQANIFSDTQGTAFFSRNQAFETGDWADNNSQKWEAFEARVLQAGYADMSSFINNNSGSMPFNDFVFQATLKYLNNNYFNNNSGGSSLVRDDSVIPNASFYKGYNNTMKLPSGFIGIDDSGVYISPGKPPKTRGADEDISFEEREKTCINSVVDTNGGVSIDQQGYDSMRDTASKQFDAPTAGKGIINSTYDLVCSKIDSKAMDAIKDTVTGLLSGGNEDIKTALGSAVDAVQGTGEIIKPVDSFLKGNDEEAGTENLGNMKNMLFGQLSGPAKTIARYSTKLVETFSMKTLDYSIKTIGDGLKILNPWNPGN